MSMRPGGRSFDEIRPVRFDLGVVKHAAGSAIAHFGETRVICTAHVETGVPQFLRGSGRGWITAEYGMLPGATNTRTMREAVAGRQSGRTVEIQRIIGRSLRLTTDMERIGETTLRVDCDVIQADGGTRTAAISGGCVALAIALRSLAPEAFLGLVASISVGLRNGQPLLDLEYIEDSRADTDMNVVSMDGRGYMELQGTAEREPFSRAELDVLLNLAQKGIDEIFAIQREALSMS